MGIRLEGRLAVSAYDYTMDPSGFVLLSDYVPQAIQEIRYFSTFNFVGERVDGYEEPCAIITPEAARALKGASNELNVLGYRIKVFDAYRPTSAVRHFVFWALEDDDVRMKPYFYPKIDKTDTIRLGYIAKESSHSRGSTIDLTLLDMKSGKEVDMGTAFDYFGELSHPDNRDITDEQFENRMLLQRVMVRHGFAPYECEWWHFTLENEPYPDTYFSFPVSSAYLKRGRV